MGQGTIWNANIRNQFITPQGTYTVDTFCSLHASSPPLEDNLFGWRVRGQHRSCPILFWIIGFFIFTLKVNFLWALQTNQILPNLLHSSVASHGSSGTVSQTSSGQCGGTPWTWGDSRRTKWSTTTARRGLSQQR